MSSLSDGRHYRELRHKDEIEDTTTDKNALAVSSEQRIVDSDDLSLFPNFSKQRKRSQSCSTCITVNTMFSSLTEECKNRICQIVGLCCNKTITTNKCLGCRECRGKKL